MNDLNTEIGYLVNNNPVDLGILEITTETKKPLKK